MKKMLISKKCELFEYYIYGIEWPWLFLNIRFVQRIHHIRSYSLFSTFLLINFSFFFRECESERQRHITACSSETKTSILQSFHFISFFDHLCGCVCAVLIYILSCAVLCDILVIFQTYSILKRVSFALAVFLLCSLSFFPYSVLCVFRIHI